MPTSRAPESPSRIAVALLVVSLFGPLLGLTTTAATPMGAAAAGAVEGNVVAVSSSDGPSTAPDAATEGTDVYVAWFEH